jgi:hypothetical protein
MDDNEGAAKAVDDRGTSETRGRQLLKGLRDTGFEGSDEKFAIALGGIAKERGIEIE